MKFLSVFLIACATLLGGCASDFSAPKTAAGEHPEESYVSLGSNIPRKGTRNPDSGINLQDLDNARQMGGATLNGTALKTQ